MKRTLLMMGILIFGFLNVAAQDKETPQLKEYVDIIHMEVYLRALQKGKPVAGLKKEDLVLYENGKPVEISSMTEVKRKIGVQQLSIGEETKKHKPRFFLLYFWVSEKKARFTKALDYFFNNVYRDGDYVVLSVHNRAFKVSRREDILPQLKGFYKAVDEITTRIDNDITYLARNLEETCDQIRKYVLRLTIAKEPEINFVRDELTKLKRLFVFYTVNEPKNIKYKYMKVSGKRLMALGNSLKNLKMEKWAIVFYQPPVFPYPDIKNEYLRQIMDMSFDGEIEGQTKVANQQLERFITLDSKKPENTAMIPRIRQTFFDANTTFHMVMMDSPKKMDVNSEFLKMDYMASEWEDTFRNITVATGGEVVGRMKLDDAVSKISGREDVYYILTYAHADTGKKVNKLKVTHRNPDIRLFHHKRMDLNQIEDIVLDNISYTHPALSFKLKNYRMIYDNDQFQGAVNLKISSMDPKGDMDEFSKEVILTEEEAELSLALNLPFDTQFMLTVEAADKHTGKKSVSTYKIKTPPIPKELQRKKIDVRIAEMDQDLLPQVLKKTAEYCEKLERAALHFYCKENVVQELRKNQNRGEDFSMDEANLFRLDSGIKKNDVRYKRMSYTYDYQIVLQDGRVQENRTLINRKGKRVEEKDATLETRFYSEYSFYLPLVFSKNNQDNYMYKLLKETVLHGRKVIMVEVIPRTGTGGDLSHGIGWVDSKDGSVLKIEMNPRAVRGIEELKKDARGRGYDLELVDEHWYLKKRRGIRFPTMTTIVERYNKVYGVKSFLGSKTQFVYKDYHFFNVGVDVSTQDVTLSDNQ